MNEQITVGAAAIMGSLTLATGLVRWAVAPPAPRGRHRAAHLLPDEADLIGPPSPYTQVDPNADTQAFGVVRQGFGWCDPCQNTTAGIITRNGFRCGEYYRHPAGGAA